ncbi:MAG: glycoside hydrolase [Bryobacteraceae bacterium]|nr:glycoside hydrolase [Bryobacteraceae bacterium]
MTYVCFLWHMHQPFYKDLATGEYRLPWTRLHALKDYYGMVQVLEEFPTIHQTFNLVPSMVEQIEDYAAGTASDPFLRLALKPGEQLTGAERDFILRYFFQANVRQLIYRYPRYARLYEQWKSGVPEPEWTVAGMRDLQVLSQLAWFDEFFLAGDAEVRELVAKGHSYTLADQALMGRKQLEITSRAVPVYRDFAARGQIEISTTPYYHPILPLLCDTQVAGVSHPGVPLPTRFRYPEDARRQLERSRAYLAARTGGAPVGLWPSEGSVSDEALALAADSGYTWAATDNGVLGRTLNQHAGPELTYRPYVWRQGGREMRMIFRDHELSDLIGFTYSGVEPAKAAAHFLQKIRANVHGRDALVPVILDGENCWEYYAESGREFLRRLYQGIAEDRSMEALTVSEALARVEPTPLGHIFPGSWINANFDVWIGAEEDNRAWEYLLRARQAYDAAQREGKLPAAKLAEAFEEIQIAEGSDWCWWYGPEHSSDNRADFDDLYRAHLRNIYHALGQPPPEELSRPILRQVAESRPETPAGPISPLIDGRVTSYFEWLGAGVYEVDTRQGAMHGGKQWVRRVLYGADAEWVYVRLDFVAGADLTGVRLRLRAGESVVGLSFASFASESITAASEEIFEARLPRAQFGSLSLEVIQDGIVRQRLPAMGEFEPGATPAVTWGA